MATSITLMTIRRFDNRRLNKEHRSGTSKTRLLYLDASPIAPLARKEAVQPAPIILKRWLGHARFDDGPKQSGGCCSPRRRSGSREQIHHHTYQSSWFTRPMRMLQQKLLSERMRPVGQLIDGGDLTTSAYVLATVGTVHMNPEWVGRHPKAFGIRRERCLYIVSFNTDQRWCSTRQAGLLALEERWQSGNLSALASNEQPNHCHLNACFTGRRPLGIPKTV